MSRKTSLVVLFFTLLCSTSRDVAAQDDSAGFSNYQFSSERVSAAWKEYTKVLQKEFATKNLAWPPSDIHLRAFKSQNVMEMWARNNETEAYKRVKTYPICALSGSLGPKRQQGDKQVPEGFYFIDDFNPKSDYHLSLLLNYPNYSDETQATSKPGGDIYIHGGCLTVGCLPMNDGGIREIYTACLNARLNGQEHIPVHIFPTRMNKEGVNYLIRQYDGQTSKQQFWAGLKKGYDYFEQHHKLLPVMYASDGTYLN